jgi:ribulose-5-phosphate 4-epimerase/fuculose-1-phosphate aldolase
VTPPETEKTVEPIPEAELRSLVAASGKILYHQGLVDYLGHCSIRVPGTDRIIIKPKHSPTIRGLGSVGPDDMLVIDVDGRVLEGDAKPPAEACIHTEIYRARPDVTAVVHTHQPESTLLGVIGAELMPVLHVQSVLTNGGRIANWPCPLLVTTPELGQDLAKALGEESLCHLQGHGIVSVAADIRLATVAAIALEQLAQANLQILQTGRSPRLITSEELGELTTALASIEGRWAYYLEQLS